MSVAKLHKQERPRTTCLTRRHFLAVASAAGGAVLLNDYLPGIARADDEEKEKKGHVHAKRPTCVALVDDSHAITSDDDGKLILWDITKETPVQVTTFAKSHAGKASYVSFAAATKTVFTAGYD